MYVSALNRGHFIPDNYIENKYINHPVHHNDRVVNVKQISSVDCTILKCPQFIC